MRNLYIVAYFVLLQNSVFGFVAIHGCNESKETLVNKEEYVNPTNPQIYSMQIQSNVTNQIVKTLLTSKVRNLNKTTEHTTFSVTLPENAFISDFEMEIKGKIYKAYVKGKEQAKKLFENAISQDQSAAHVELNASDYNTFIVSVNLEPASSIIFRLAYEELIQHRNGQYELAININPGQIVDDLTFQVSIEESRPLKLVSTPSWRTGIKIEILDEHTAVVKFNPGLKERKEFGKYLNAKKTGLAGQFIVQYDVERTLQRGEVSVRDDNRGCTSGPVTINTTNVESARSFLERLRAYIKVRVLLKNKEIEEDATELNKKALELSLKYSFVTPVTSLVVVKPLEPAWIGGGGGGNYNYGFGRRGHDQSVCPFPLCPDRDYAVHTKPIGHSFLKFGK